MPIVSGDIDYKQSGAAPDNLGGAIHANDIPNDTAAALFDHVSGDESSGGDTEYRCGYIKNSHGSLTANNARLWLQSDTSSADSDFEIAVGTAAINGTEQTIGTESTAPSGVSWVNNATDYASGIALGNIPAGQHKAFWVKRVINPGAAAKNNDTATFRAGVDTAE